jgi:dTDP-4-dehydrorhamnose reductase
VKILIIGGRGQLGASLKEVWADRDVVSPGRLEINITDAGQVREAVRALRPDIVVNTAAIRRPDTCEDQPEQAFAVNAIGARHVAMACAETGSALVHISTDGVFDGEKTGPYVEDDAPNPITTYGVTKLAAECFVRNLTPRHYIVRTSGLFGGPAEGHAGNFVLTLLGLSRNGSESRVVTDQLVSPTYTPDLARKIAWLVTTERFGTYHIPNRGGCSWYEFAQVVFARGRLTTPLVPTTTAELGLRSRRLKNAVLANDALQRLGADDLPGWQDGVERYLDSLVAGDRVGA